jgi:hypothetical protein
VAGEVQDRSAPIQRDAKPFDLASISAPRPFRTFTIVLPFEIGINRMGENRMQHFADGGSRSGLTDG